MNIEKEYSDLLEGLVQSSYVRARVSLLRIEQFTGIEQASKSLGLVVERAMHRVFDYFLKARDNDNHEEIMYQRLIRQSQDARCIGKLAVSISVGNPQYLTELMHTSVLMAKSLEGQKTYFEWLKSEAELQGVYTGTSFIQVDGSQRSLLGALLLRAQLDSVQFAPDADDQGQFMERVGALYDFANKKLTSFGEKAMLGCQGYFTKYYLNKDHAPIEVYMLLERMAAEAQSRELMSAISGPKRGSVSTSSSV